MDRLFSKCGFSLVELAVVLVIISSIAGVSIGLGGAQQKVAKIKGVNQTLEVINTALKTYHLKNGRYPCPAVLTQASTHASYGLEATGCNSSCPAGLICNGIAIEGFIPFKTIGLSESIAYDSWGGRIRYVVDNNHVVSSTYANGGLALRDIGGNEITSSAVLGKAIYVLLSHGSDKKGAYNKAGSLLAACGATARDSENCDGDATIVSSTVIETQDTSAATYFQDYVSWQTQKNVQLSMQVAMTISSGIQKLSVGHVHTCIINSANQLLCTGFNGAGRLGIGTIDNSLVFVRESLNLSDWKHVSAKDEYSCGVRLGGEGYCWGYNRFGKLGLGAGLINTTQTNPTLISGYNWDIIQAGDDHTCGITDTKELYCWGRNNDGQIGDTSFINRSSPVKIGTNNDWEVIALSDYSTCGIRNGGELYCWGDNNHGEQGSGTTGGNVTSPTLVAGFNDWEYISSSSSRASYCAIRRNGRLYCWGENIQGALGNGGMSDVSVPTEVVREDGTTPGYTDWIFVSLSVATSCGIRANGLAYCWGSNDDRQLGDSTNINTAIPVKVTGGITNWRNIQINENDFGACAVNTAGKLYCWGYSGIFGGYTIFGQVLPSYSPITEITSVTLNGN
jgi:prepilin-type N-terminal cleavage/methylation domain-containing protein